MPARSHGPARDRTNEHRYRAARKELKRTGPNVCHRCRYPIDLQLDYPHPLSWSADHKVPRSQLRPDDPRRWHVSNLIEAHLRCNQSRGDKPLTTATPTLNTSRRW